MPLTVSAPNEVWRTDFKGQFKTLDGVYCYPLTVQDAHSRFVLGVEALPSVKQKGVFPIFECLFEEYGLYLFSVRRRVAARTRRLP
jgi:hypothetical protein